jgi:N-acetylmuramoyl-L-alanine amidase
MVQATGYEDRNHGGIKTDGLLVISKLNHDQSTAAVLTEPSFMDVVKEADRLDTDIYIQSLGVHLARGIENYIWKFVD